MEHKELKNHIAEVIEEYKEDMDGEGYDYSDWTVDPQVCEQIFTFVEALPKDLPWPEPFIDEDELYVGWGYEDQSWLTITVAGGQMIRWDCEIYQDLTEDEDPECFWGMFPLSKGIPQQVHDFIRCIVTR